MVLLLLFGWVDLKVLFSQSWECTAAPVLEAGNARQWVVHPSMHGGEIPELQSCTLTAPGAPACPELACPASGVMKRKKKKKLRKLFFLEPALSGLRNEWGSTMGRLSQWQQWTSCSAGAADARAMPLQGRGVTCSVLELPQGGRTILWWRRSIPCLGSVLELNLLFSMSQPAWESAHPLSMVPAIVRTSRKFSASGKSTGKNDVLKKILDSSFMKNTNGNLRSGPNDNEWEGSVQSSYLPELQYLLQLFLVKTAEMVYLGQILFLTTADHMVYDSFLDVWKVCMPDQFKVSGC